jgi:hypothetical protein
MNSSIVARYFFTKFLLICLFKFKETVFGVLQNFRVAFMEKVARTDQLSNAVAPHKVIQQSGATGLI